MQQELEDRLSGLEQRLGVRFQNRMLLLKAITTREYAIYSSSCNWENNEVLEFLGDSVLSLCIIELLMSQFPEKREGALVQIHDVLARNDTLFQIGKELNLLNFALLSPSEVDGPLSNTKKTILSGLMEAIIGALYRDQGIEECKILVFQLFNVRLHEFVQSTINYQEMAERAIRRKYKAQARYVILSQDSSLCSIGLYIGPRQLIRAEAPTEKEARQEVAKALVLQIDAQIRHERERKQRRPAERWVRNR